MPQQSNMLSMYTSLLDNSPAVAAEIHRAAWAYATATENTMLLRTLMARLDAPADMVAVYATVTDPALRGVYTARLDLGAAQQAESLRGERRVKVLVDALKRTGNAGPVVAVAVEAFMLKPTKALAEQFLNIERDWLTPELATNVLRTLAADPSNEYNSRTLSGFARVASCTLRENAQALLQDIEHSNVAGCLMRFDVGDDMVLDTIKRLRPRIVEDLSHRYAANRAYGQAHSLIEGALWGRVANTAILSEINTMLRESTGAFSSLLRDAYAKMVAAPRSAPVEWARNPGEKLRTLLASDVPESTVDVTQLSKGEILQLGASSQPPVVSAVVTAVLENPNIGPDATVVRHLLTNPVLTVEQRHDLLNGLRHRTRHSMGREMVDAITLFPGDDLVREVWCETFPELVLEQHGWAPFGGPERAAELLGQWGQSGEQTAKSAIAAALQVGVTPKALEVLPASWIKFLPHWNGRQSAEPVMLRLYSDMLAEAFTGTPAAWKMYEQLEPDFPGTIRELLDTCRTAMS